MKIFSSNAGGNSDGFDFSPASIDSAVHSSNINIKLSAPLGMCQRQILISYEFIGAFIIALLFCCSPSAIIWRVIAVVVDSINRMLVGRSIAHVSVKVFKAIDPSITYFYATGPVKMVVCSIFVVASRFHACPNTKYRCSAHSMRCIPNARLAFLITAARHSVSVNHVRCPDDFFSPAATLAKPIYSVCFGSFYGKQANKVAKYFAGKVECATVCYNSLIHNLTSNKFVLGVRALSRPVSPIITLGACHA